MLINSDKEKTQIKLEIENVALRQRITRVYFKKLLSNKLERSRETDTFPGKYDSLQHKFNIKVVVVFL